MLCPICNSDTKVTDTRPTHEGHRIRRRRECFKCHERFTTSEIIIADKMNTLGISKHISDRRDAMRRAINFVADAQAALKNELGRME